MGICVSPWAYTRGVIATLEYVFCGHFTIISLVQIVNKCLLAHKLLIYVQAYFGAYELIWFRLMQNKPKSKKLNMNPLTYLAYSKPN